MACEIRRGARCKRRLQPELMSGTLPETYTKRGVGWKWGYGRRGESEGWDGWTVGRKRKDTWKARLGQNAYDNQTEVLREGKERRGRHGEKERRKEMRRKGECRE